MGNNQGKREISGYLIQNYIRNEGQKTKARKLRRSLMLTHTD